LENLGTIVADPELRTLFKSVATRKINADLKTLQAHAELSRRLAKNRRIGPGGGADPLKQIVREHLEYYGTLIDLSLTFHQRLIDTLASMNDAETHEPAINGLTLALNAPRGATVRAPFKISNNRPDPIHVTCRASPFVSDDGAQLIASRIAFLPPSAEIAPGSEEIFEAILPVGPDFDAGKLYLATLTADGFDAMSIVVRLKVEAPAVSASAANDENAAAEPVLQPAKKPAKARAPKSTSAASQKAALTPAARRRKRSA
jgi:hypothetical protein